MTLYLRDDKGDNILDIDICVKTNGDSSYVELISLVHIPIYSNLLLNNLNKKNKIIHDFDNLSNLRGWLWERYFMIGENDVNKFDHIIEQLKRILTKVAKDYNLNLIEKS
jgi:hypothetical protein